MSSPAQEGTTTQATQTTLDHGAGAVDSKPAAVMSLPSFSTLAADTGGARATANATRWEGVVAYWTDPVPDGARAWWGVVGAVCALFSSLGIVYAVGIFVPLFVVEFGATQAQASLVGTLTLGFFYIGGIVAGPLSDRYGCRRIILLGIAMWVPGVVLSSYAQAVWQLQLSLGVLTGLGCAMIMWPTMSVVPTWFFKLRATAVSLASLGSGAGNLALAYGGENLVAQYGWRSTLRIIAGLGAGLVCIALLLVERRLPRVSRGNIFGPSLRLLRTDRNYRIFLVASFLFQWGFFVPFEELPTYVLWLGYDANFAGLASAMLGVGTIVGRLLLGPASDALGRYRVFHWSIVAAGITLLTWPAATSQGGIIAWALIFPATAGGFIGETLAAWRDATTPTDARARPATFPVIAANQCVAPRPSSREPATD